MMDAERTWRSISRGLVTARIWWSRAPNPCKPVSKVTRLLTNGPQWLASDDGDMVSPASTKTWMFRHEDVSDHPGDRGPARRRHRYRQRQDDLGPDQRVGATLAGLRN